MAMKKEHPIEYDFFPLTFILPYEINAFKAQFYRKKKEDEKVEEMQGKVKKKANKELLTNKIFIIKPECES